LPQTVTFSNSKRNHSLVVEEFAMGINEPVWIEHIWKENKTENKDPADSK
jgi:hypothetical protein